jgi:hypothetical protein
MPRSITVEHGKKFMSLDDARAGTVAWRTDSGRKRLHGPPDHLAPDEFHERNQAHRTLKKVAHATLELSR